MPKYTPIIANPSSVFDNTALQGDFIAPHMESIGATLSYAPPSAQDITGMMTQLGVPQTPDTDQQITRIQQHRDQFDAFMNTFYDSVDVTEPLQANIGLGDFGSLGGLGLGFLFAYGVYRVAEWYRHQENKIQKASVSVGISITRFFMIGIVILISLAAISSYFGYQKLTNWFQEDKTIDINKEKKEQETEAQQAFAVKSQETVDWLHLQQDLDVAIYRGPGCVFEFEFLGKPGLMLRVETIGGLHQGNVLVYTCTLLQNGTALAIQLLERDMTGRWPRLTSSVELGEFRRGEDSPDKKLSKLGRMKLISAKTLGSKGGSIQVAGPEPEEDEYNPTMNPDIFSSATQDAIEALFARLGEQIPRGTYIMTDEANNIKVQVQMQNKQSGTITRVIGSGTQMAQLQQVQISYSDNEVHLQYGNIETSTIEAGKELLLKKRMEAVQTNLQNGNWTLVQ